MSAGIFVVLATASSVIASLALALVVGAVAYGLILFAIRFSDQRDDARSAESGQRKRAR